MCVGAAPDYLDPDALRVLWDAATEQHAALRADTVDSQLPSWRHEQQCLVAALRGDELRFVVVARRGDEFVGYARVDIVPGGLAIWPPTDRIGKLEMLAVPPGLRGVGIGTDLVDAVLAELAVRQVPMVFVTFWRENVAAKRFYEQHGFRADARGRYQRWCT